MSTPIQTLANRENAKLSTGPRTASGKEASKYNASKHGLSGKQIVLGSEDAAEYKRICTGLVDHHAPQNEHEAMLVQQIAASWWRLQRAYRTEREIVDELGLVEIFLDDAKSAKYRNFTRHLNAIERQWRAATNELHRMQQLRKEEKSNPAPLSTAAAYANGFVLSESTVTAEYVSPQPNGEPTASDRETDRH
jgi:hypothetical protein